MPPDSAAPARSKDVKFVYAERIEDVLRAVFEEPMEVQEMASM